MPPALCHTIISQPETGGKGPRATKRLNEPLMTPDPILATRPPQLQAARLEGPSRRRGSQGRAVATGNEGKHRVYSGNPAFRRPSRIASTHSGFISIP